MRTGSPCSIFSKILNQTGWILGSLSGTTLKSSTFLSPQSILYLWDSEVCSNTPYVMIPTLKDVESAVKRIGPLVHNTPVLTSSTIDRMMNATVFFKCENFQRMGAFKIRGATNAILQLSKDERARGVITHSSVNFAAALALFES